MEKCLIIDDVTVSRMAASKILDDIGINHVEASDEKEAMDKLKKEKISFILLDWHLKKNSGIDFMNHIFEKHDKDIKIILFSGVEDDKKREEALESGALGYICKPVTKEKMQAELQKAGIL